MRTTKSRADAQADLSLRWAHMSDGTFSHVVAQAHRIAKQCRSWSNYSFRIFGANNEVYLYKKANYS